MSEVEFARQIARNGFATAESVLSQREVEASRQAIAAIPNGEQVRRRRDTYGIRNLFDVCAPVRELANHPGLMSLAAAVLEAHCFAVRAILFDKTPEANWGLGWHRDRAIAVRKRIDVTGFVGWSKKAGVLHVHPPAHVLAGMLALRVHLDDCGPENGPLRVLPGSHQPPSLNDDLEVWRRRVAPEVCTVRAGGVVGMRPLLFHASSAATTPSHRRVVHIEYAANELPNGLEWNWRLRT